MAEEEIDTFELIAALRGGVPAQCDFCGQEFTDDNPPQPEEAGDWACFECVKRWAKEDAKWYREGPQ